ncbi:MAG: cation:proton antiporter [Bacteroidales bacterium]|nr:cation:proton antiporter [Bacteroidales bacterium]
MSSLPPIFLDLAIILITAGAITIVFKWLKQPLVLGYIVAGFFIGPYFPWFPAITDVSNVHVWSDIGIVFLMFALGLEFSIKKLKRVGATGAITALTELVIMFVIGNTVGHLLGMGNMDSIFLGCMLSISSTTIIIKSFDDLKLKQQRFTSTVTAVLVVEDLIAVLLLVVLSTLSVGKSFNGAELGLSLVKLVFSLIVWFTFGIFLIPTFLRWMRKWMTEETLCIVAVGLCFGMVVLADFAGFSTALGAFVMGAILSETIEADVIHRIITPIKNLFGAVFFVSVGMLVNPEVLVKYIGPILIIAGIIVVFKSLSATTGILLSGKPLKTAMQGGFCFCQIGEFSFIIAGLGLSYHVIDPNLYPIIVTVSILTTFVTPYMIKAGLPAYEWIYPKLPMRFKQALERYSSSGRVNTHEKKLSTFVRKQLTSILFYSAILVALGLLSSLWLKPLINNTFEAWKIPAIWGNLLGMIATLLIMAPFLWALAVKNVNRERIRKMLHTYSHSQVAVIPLLALRYFITLFIVGWMISTYVHLAVGLVVVVAIVVVAAVLLSRRATDFYNRIEDHFVTNFYQRQAQNSFKIPESLEKNFVMERMVVTAYSPFAGKSLKDSRFRQDYGVNIISIERAGKIYDLPDKEMLIMPTDRLTVLGNEEQLAHVRSAIEVEPDMLVHDHSDNEINTYRLEVGNNSRLTGVSIKQSDLMANYQSMVIAIERGKDYMVNPPADTVFHHGDIVWLVSPLDLKINDLCKTSN